MGSLISKDSKKEKEEERARTAKKLEKSKP